VSGTPRSDKILITAQCIADYIGVSKPMLYSLLKEGLPATIIGRCLMAHAANIEEFMQKRTRGRVAEMPQDAE